MGSFCRVGQGTQGFLGRVGIGEEAELVSFPDVPKFRKFGYFGRVTESGVRESVCVEMSVGERSSLGEGVDDGGSRK